MKKLLTIIIAIPISLGCFGQMTMNARHFTARLDTATAAPAEDNTISCTSDGIAYIASTVYEGYWEYDFRRTTGTTNTYIAILSEVNGASNQDNIRTYINVNEVFAVREYTGFTPTDYFETASAYTVANTWYRLRYERNTTLNEFFTGAIGDIRVLIKGGSFGTGSWTVIAPDSGTNPTSESAHNTSDYFLINFDTGDQLRDLDINGATINADDFTIGSGTYETSVNNDPL